MSIAEGGPRRLAATAPAAGSVAIAWLGQAGFLIRTASHTLLIDPYLSDFLARKYRGREFPHERLVPPPLAVADIARLDLVLCTHRHSDHMDPDTLAEIATRHPACRFVIPAADVDHARSLGLPADRLLAIDAGETLAPAAGLSVAAVPAAHESLDRDAAGRCRFLGYDLPLRRHRCVPRPARFARPPRHRLRDFARQRPRRVSHRAGRAGQHVGRRGDHALPHGRHPAARALPFRIVRVQHGAGR
jgi:hypothetical protein